jgi:hypothetical protein
MSEAQKQSEEMMTKEEEEQKNQKEEVEKQKIMNQIQRQMFASTQTTPTPEGFVPQQQGEFDTEEQQLSTYDQAYINQNNLINESFFMKGKQNRYIKFKAMNDLIVAYENKQPLPDYSKLSLYNYYV